MTYLGKGLSKNERVLPLRPEGWRVCGHCGREFLSGGDWLCPDCRDEFEREIEARVKRSEWWNDGENS